MAHIRKSTTLRTIRLTRDLDNLLQNDAKSKNISINSLLTSLIVKYAEWDRYAEKFGLVSLTRADSKSILEAIDDSKLSQIGQDLGKRAFKEFIILWFKKIDVEKVLEGISLWCKYTGNAKYELETDGRNYTITLNHEIGEKWSNLMGHLVSEGIKTVLGLPNAKFDFTNSFNNNQILCTLIIKFLESSELKDDKRFDANANLTRNRDGTWSVDSKEKTRLNVWTEGSGDFRRKGGMVIMVFSR